MVSATRPGSTARLHSRGMAGNTETTPAVPGIGSVRNAGMPVSSVRAVASSDQRWSGTVPVRDRRPRRGVNTTAGAGSSAGTGKRCTIRLRASCSSATKSRPASPPSGGKVTVPDRARAKVGIASSASAPSAAYCQRTAWPVCVRRSSMADSARRPIGASSSASGGESSCWRRRKRRVSPSSS